MAANPAVYTAQLESVIYKYNLIARSLSIFIHVECYCVPRFADLVPRMFTMTAQIDWVLSAIRWLTYSTRIANRKEPMGIVWIMYMYIIDNILAIYMQLALCNVLYCRRFHQHHRDIRINPALRTIIVFSMSDIHKIFLNRIGQLISLFCWRLRMSKKCHSAIAKGRICICIYENVSINGFPISHVKTIPTIAGN